MESTGHYKISVTHSEHIQAGILAGKGSQLGHLHNRLLCEHLLLIFHRDKLHLRGILLQTKEVSIRMAHPTSQVFLQPHYNSAIYSYSW